MLFRCPSQVLGNIMFTSHPQFCFWTTSTSLWLVQAGLYALHMMIDRAYSIQHTVLQYVSCDAVPENVVNPEAKRLSGMWCAQHQNAPKCSISNVILN